MGEPLTNHRFKVKAQLAKLMSQVPIDHTTGELEELLKIVKATPKRPRKANDQVPG